MSANGGAGKSFAEIVTMPLVIALIGIVGTLAVTRYQTKSAEVNSNAQLVSARLMADAEGARLDKEAATQKQLKLKKVS